MPGAGRLATLALGAAFVASGFSAEARPALADDVASAAGAPIDVRTERAVGQRRIEETPGSWMDALATSRGGTATSVSCTDADANGRLNALDDPQLFALDIPLTRSVECSSVPGRAEFYEGVPDAPGAFSCASGGRPLLIVAIGGGGTSLSERTLGESAGLVDIVNDLQVRASASGVAAQPVLSAAAIDAADMPQLRMEQWLANYLARRLDAMPCLEAVLIGHSHGAVTVTSVASVLDPMFGERLFCVILDRTLALYDHGTEAYPAGAPILNVFQTNEGWHGVRLSAPNVTNVDASRAIAPSDGIGPPVEVTHLTLDDAPAVRRTIVEAVARWRETQALRETVIRPN